MVPENPHPGILDRDIPAVLARQQFPSAFSLLRDVVAYGTNLIPRCIGSSSQTLLDVVILGSLLRQAVAMLDSVEVLLDRAAVQAAALPSRTLLELYFSILWIQAEESDRRAKHYFVWNLRQDKLWASRLIQGTPDNEAFHHVNERFGLREGDADSEEVKNAAAEVAAVERLLSRDEIKDIASNFDLHRMRRGYEVQWFVPTGSSSIREMAIKLDLKAEYDALYSPLSAVAHGARYTTNIKLGPEPMLKPIRDTHEFGTIASLSLSISFEIYRKILGWYRASELSNFSRKYVEEWQAAFMALRRRAS